MQNSTIRDLYYERIGTINTIKPTKRYFKLLNKLCKMEKTLFEKCDEDVKKLLDEYIDLRSEMECENLINYYSEGFKIGTRLAFECAE